LFCRAGPVQSPGGKAQEPAAGTAVAQALLPGVEAGYTAVRESEEAMRIFVVTVAALAVFAAQGDAANAAAKKNQPPVMRTASGTVIQPTKTIFHDANGHTTVIVVRPRSYLDTGTEVSIGDRKFSDYAYSPMGDPGRSTWFFGPSVVPSGGIPIPQPGYIPGFNPNLP
jgi:hypothetical protein